MVRGDLHWPLDQITFSSSVIDAAHGQHSVFNMLASTHYTLHALHKYSSRVHVLPAPSCLDAFRKSEEYCFGSRDSMKITSHGIHDPGACMQATGAQSATLSQPLAHAPLQCSSQMLPLHSVLQPEEAPPPPPPPKRQRTRMKCSLTAPSQWISLHWPCFA